MHPAAIDTFNQATRSKVNELENQLFEALIDGRVAQALHNLTLADSSSNVDTSIADSPVGIVAPFVDFAVKSVGLIGKYQKHEFQPDELQQVLAALKPVPYNKRSSIPDSVKFGIAKYLGNLALDYGLPAEVPAIIGIVESDLANVIRNGQENGQSDTGIFQQRIGPISKGQYGSYEQIMNPEYAVKMLAKRANEVMNGFYKQCYPTYPNGRMVPTGKGKYKFVTGKMVPVRVPKPWKELLQNPNDPNYLKWLGYFCQAMQVSGFPEKYYQKSSKALNYLFTGLRPLSNNIATNTETSTTNLPPKPPLTGQIGS